ncbi:unnamed protein product, partial [Didymodactylos carnosus]
RLIILSKVVHEKPGHGARDKMRREINQHYYWMPSNVIDIYLLNLCCIFFTTPASNSSILVDPTTADAISTLDDAINLTASVFIMQSSPQTNSSTTTYNNVNDHYCDEQILFDDTSTPNLGSINSSHLVIRKRAAEVDLANANRRIKAHKQLLKLNISELEEISVITASKMYYRGAVTGISVKVDVKPENVPVRETTRFARKNVIKWCLL